MSFGDDVYKRGEAERFGYELPLTVDDLIFLQDLGVQMSTMDVKRACELDNYYWTPFQDGAGSCYVTRVAVLRREGAIRHWQKFAAKTWGRGSGCRRRLAQREHGSRRRLYDRRGVVVATG